MIKVAEIQSLTITDKLENGFYMTDSTEAGDVEVWLGIEEANLDLNKGDCLDVFVYRHSDGQLFATQKTPLIQKNEVALLEVVSVKPIGAFLNWGLSKDLFLPFSEQLWPVRKGQKCLVSLYVDKAGRPCATMKFKKHLSLNPTFKKGEIVDCQVYDVSQSLGAFVVVEKQYEGLILENALVQKVHLYDQVEARVTRIREDGRIDLSQLPTANDKIEYDTKIIWTALSDNAGRLPLNDNSSPELIKKELNMSKKAFKRAVGKLLKSNKIRITDEGIEML